MVRLAFLRCVAINTDDFRVPACRCVGMGGFGIPGLYGVPYTPSPFDPQIYGNPSDGTSAGAVGGPGRPGSGPGSPGNGPEHVANGGPAGRQWGLRLPPRKLFEPVGGRRPGGVVVLAQSAGPRGRGHAVAAQVAAGADGA